MISLLIYFYGIADKISSSLQFLIWVFGIVSILGALITSCNPAAKFSDNYDEEEGKIEKGKFLKFFKRLYIFHVIFFVFYIAVPSSKTIACMYVIPEITNSKAIQKDLPEIYDMAISALKENIKEATKHE